MCVCVCVCPLKIHATSIRGWRSDDALSLISQGNRRDVALAWLKNCQYPPAIWSSWIREKRRKIRRGGRRSIVEVRGENKRMWDFFFFFSKSSLRNYQISQIYHIFHWKKKKKSLSNFPNSLLIHIQLNCINFQTLLRFLGFSLRGNKSINTFFIQLSNPRSFPNRYLSNYVICKFSKDLKKI